MKPFPLIQSSIIASISLSANWQASAARCERYALEVVGPADACDYTPYAIAENGTIAGTYVCIASGYRLFIKTPTGPFTTIPVQPGWEAQGFGVNSAGTVVGLMENNGPYFAFHTVNGAVTTLPVIQNGNWAAAYAINESNIICGYSFNSTTGNPPATSVLWIDGQIQPLDPLPGYWSQAHDITNSGDVCGYWHPQGSGPQPSRGFLWSQGTVTDIGIPPGLLSFRAYALNAKHQVVGTGPMPNPTPGTNQPTLSRAFLWHNNQWTSLGLLPGQNQSLVYDINDAGRIVGEGTIPLLTDSALLWHDGVLRSLGELVIADGPTNFYFTSARAINNAGQITGNGWYDGHFGDNKAFILTPIPPTPGDADCNDLVNIDDLTSVILNWATADENADLDASGSVDISDLNLVLSNWSTDPR